MTQDAVGHCVEIDQLVDFPRSAALRGLAEAREEPRQLAQLGIGRSGLARSNASRTAARRSSGVSQCCTSESGREGESPPRAMEQPAKAPHGHRKQSHETGK